MCLNTCFSCDLIGFPLCSDTKSYSIVWSIVILIGLVSLMNLQNIFIVEFNDPNFQSKTILSGINLLLKSLLPSIPIVVFNVILLRRMKALRKSGTTSNFGGSNRNAQLEKAVFRSKITLLISLIFFCSQVLTWIICILQFVMVSTSISII